MMNEELENEVDKLKVLADSADNENHMPTTSSTAAVLLLSITTLML